MVQEIKLNQIDTVVTTVGTPGTDGNLPTEKAVRDAIVAGGGSKFGGTGSDGAIDGTTNVTITGSNDTYIVKNYTSWAAGGAARVLTITPTNCLLHIKIQGNCDLTNWTFNFAGKGAAGGAAVSGFSDPGLDGVSGANLITGFVNGFGGAGNVAGSSTGFGGGGGAGKATDGAVGVGGGGGTAGVSALGGALSTVIAGRRFVSYIGAGGGSGGTNVNAGGGAPTSGAGGAGGGAVILEIAGNLTLDNGSTVITMNGAVGGNATTPGATGAGGGGGGGGGTFLCLYNGTLTGTVTPTVAGGAAGLKANGGTNTDGGAGGNGEFLIDKNTVFA